MLLKYLNALNRDAILITKHIICLENSVLVLTELQKLANVILQVNSNMDTANTCWVHLSMGGLYSPVFALFSGNRANKSICQKITPLFKNLYETYRKWI